MLAGCSLQLSLALSGAPLMAAAQEPAFHYRAPGTDQVTVLRDVAFGAGPTQRVDVYRLPGARPGATVIVFNGSVGQRGGAWLAGWGRTIAARGLVAFVPDLRRDSLAADWAALVNYVSRNAGRHGADAAAVAVLAGSGNVFDALPLVERTGPPTVHAAVMLYGAAPVRALRRDLPLLLVRAGLDRPDLNRQIDALVALALSQNAPVSVLNHHGGRHAFEMVDASPATVAAITQVVDFLASATRPEYLAAVRDATVEATAAGHVVRREFAPAAEAYRTLVDRRPNDATLRLSYGEALLGAGQFAAACSEFEKLRDAGLGPRDLSLPAARACLANGDPDAAIAWLQRIPRRFLPPSVRTDTAFASLRGRPAFEALFQEPPARPPGG